ATVVEDLVPVNAVLLAVERDVRGEAGALATPRIFDEAEELDGQCDGLGDAMHREGAGHVVHVLPAGRLDAGALEADLRELVGFEKVRALEILVAIVVAGVDRNRLYFEL